MTQQEGLIYQRKQEAEYEKEENRGGRGAKKSISVAGRKTRRRQKAATTTIQDGTSGCMHSSRTTMGDKPRRVRENKVLTEEWTMNRFHSE